MQAMTMVKKKIVANWKAKGNYDLHYLFSEPGLTRQRNFGFITPLVMFLTFFDDDVILDIDYLREMDDCFKQNKDIAGATGNITNLTQEIGFTTILRKLLYVNGTYSNGVMKR